MALDFQELLKRMVKERASDLFLKVGSPPSLRIDGKIRFMQADALNPEVAGTILETVRRARIEDFGESGEVDCAYDVPGIGRFRVNIYKQRGHASFAFRHIEKNIPSFEELGLPPEPIRKLAALNRGLVLVTGVTGSGKSTTLAAIVNFINENYNKHIVTLEDPIEFEHAHGRCLIHQRELGRHVESFAAGLRAALREGPDVILVGEMRDPETIAAALTAAETGHLVLSTLHSGGAAMAIDRIVDAFPPHQQGQVRLQLAHVLRALVTQLLLPSTRPGRLVPAIEKTIVNHAVAHAIREGRGHHIASQIQTGREDGMLSLELSLADLVRRGEISRETAHSAVRNPELLRELLRS